MIEGGGPRRIAIYTHDTYGLGHVRRCLHFARELATRSSETAILFVTGSPATHLLRDVPKNIDFVKVPTVVKTGPKALRPPHLPLALGEVLDLRARLVREAVVAFAPDVLLVDNFPLGSGTELLPTLQAVRNTPTRTLLGLRDVLDTPAVVQRDWRRQGMIEILDRYYDRVLVYGSPEILDAAHAYALPDRVVSKLSYCGYVASSSPACIDLQTIRRELGFEGPFLLASAGGGGDGYPLLETFLQALEHLPPLPALVITGPLMNGDQREKLRRLVPDPNRVKVVDFVDDLKSYLAAAEVSISMGGYNTAIEIIQSGVKAVIVPRTWRYGESLKRDKAGTEGEQLIRAQALSRLGLADLLEPENLTPENLAARMLAAFETRARGPRAVLPMNGVDNVVEEILDVRALTREVSRAV